MKMLLVNIVFMATRLWSVNTGTVAKLFMLI
nr:MAG TPA: hypothetical protein [Caudoviricetes sp.]